MISFKQFILEEAKGTLHSFDVDETLFKTNAKVHVKHNGKRVASLSNSEFNTHKLDPGHEYDFSEFQDSNKFHDESEPMMNMLNKVKAIHRNISKNPNHRIIINTARSDMDNKDTYLNKFKRHGVPIHDIHVFRAGNTQGPGSVASKKAEVISKILDKDKYKKVHVYDDSTSNLDAVHKLREKHPDTEFHTWHVQPDGSIKKYRPSDLNEDGAAAGLGGGGGNTVGSGAIAGVGIGPQGEPGVHPKDQPSNKKRKSDFPKSPVLPQLFKRRNPNG